VRPVLQAGSRIKGFRSSEVPGSGVLGSGVPRFGGSEVPGFRDCGRFSTAIRRPETNLGTQNLGTSEPGTPPPASALVRRSFPGGCLLFLLLLTVPSLVDAQQVASQAEAAPITEAMMALSRLRASAELFIYGVARPEALEIVAEIPSARIEGGRWRNGADVDAIVTGPNGEATGSSRARIETAARGVRVTIPKNPSDAGPWRVRIKASADGETLEDSGTVTRIESGVLLGLPLLFRAAAAPRAPVHPVADFQFRRTERVHIEWPILRPLDRQHARLFSANGQPLAIAVALGEPRPGVLTADVNLAPLGPGDYAIELTAVSGLQTAKQIVPLRVKQN